MRKLTHAILIEGGDESRRLAKAMELLKGHFADDPLAAKKLGLGVFEDLTILKADEDKDTITVEMIEGLISVFKQKPFASTGKACIIPCGEQMNDQAQNKLLKLLEEPAPGDVILIMTANAERLAQTVRSRCMRIWLGYPKPAGVQLTDDLKKLTASLVYGKGAFAEAGQVFSRYEGSREEAADFIRAFQVFLRRLIVGRLAPGMDGPEAEDESWFRETASKVQPKHADRMRRGVLSAEKALRDIERGDRVRYVLRGMALAMRTGADY